MAGGLDGDDATGMEVIKESLGLTDQDLAPESDQLDWGDGDTSDGEGDDLSEQSEQQDRQAPQAEQDYQRDNRQERQVPQQREQKVDPLKQNTLKFDPRATFRQDQKGNLVDTRTGELIARAGSEARIYQRVHKQATDYIRAASGNIQNQMQQERGKLNRAVEIGLGFEKELSELKSYVNQINAHELPKEQLLEAAGLFKQAQTDPVGVLRNLLTRAALGGIDISQLGLDPQHHMDPKAMLDMVRREIQSGVAPVTQYTQQQQREREEQQVNSQYLRQAETQVNQFFGKTKEALPYTHIFHAVLQQPQFQHMSLGEIWDKIQLHLMRNGVDPRQAPSRTQRQRLNGTPDGQRAPSRSLPNGQGMAPSGGDMGGKGPAGPAHPSMSYDAIIREVLGSARR